MRRSLIALAVLATLAVPSTALAATRTAHAGKVTATLSWTGQIPNEKHVTLRIVRAGNAILRTAVTAKTCGHSCDVLTGAKQPPIQVIDLDHTGEPNVVISLYTGGAHCCSIAQVFTYGAATRRYTMIQRDFGDPGFLVKDLGHNGQREFVTADDRFAYTFTDYAASGMPLQILALRGTRFTDVTSSYPALVRTDAARYLSVYKQLAKSRYQDSVGVIAAWAADECTLGKSTTALAYVKAQAKAGHLNSGFGAGDSGQKFVTKLERFLRRQGYLS